MCERGGGRERDERQGERMGRIARGGQGGMGETSCFEEEEKESGKRERAIGGGGLRERGLGGGREREDVSGAQGGE